MFRHTLSSVTAGAYVRGGSVVDPWAVRGRSVAATDVEGPGQAHAVTRNQQGGHHERIRDHRLVRAAPGSPAARRPHGSVGPAPPLGPTAVSALVAFTGPALVRRSPP